MLSRDEYKEIGNMPIVDMTVGNVLAYFDQISEMVDKEFIDGKNSTTLALTAARCEFVSECLLSYQRQKSQIELNEQIKKTSVAAKPETKPAKFEPPVYPGQTIILKLDEERKCRVIDVDERGFATLVGLFSIGEVDELENFYSGGASDSFCAKWFETFPPEAVREMKMKYLPNKEIRLVFAPILKDIDRAFKKYNYGCRDWLWLNDEDGSSFRVISDNTLGTTAMEGEDGEPHEYSNVDFNPFEVHPCFLINLRNYTSFTEDKEERAECKENYESVMELEAEYES